MIVPRSGCREENFSKSKPSLSHVLFSSKWSHALPTHSLWVISFITIASIITYLPVTSKPTYSILYSPLLGWLMVTRTPHVQTELLTFLFTLAPSSLSQKWHYHLLLLKTETWKLCLVLPFPPPPHSKWVTKSCSSSCIFINLSTSFGLTATTLVLHLLNYLLVSPFPFLLHSNPDSTV